MPHLDAHKLITWMHLVAFAFAGGGGVVSLLLSGFEEERQDLRGLSAAVWKRVCVWSMRLAVLLGAVLLAMKLHAGDRPFDASYLPLKLGLAGGALLMAELAPRHLATGKRGGALLFLVLWMLTTVVAVNRDAFPKRHLPDVPPAELHAAP